MTGDALERLDRTASVARWRSLGRGPPVDLPLLRPHQLPDGPDEARAMLAVRCSSPARQELEEPGRTAKGLLKRTEGGNASWISEALEHCSTM